MLLSSPLYLLVYVFVLDEFRLSMIFDYVVKGKEMSAEDLIPQG